MDDKKDHVKVEEKSKPLSKEERIQSPSGTGKVQFGGAEATIENSAEVLAKAQEVLAKHGNQESNIPLDSNYWILMNTYRNLVSEENTAKARKAEEERNK